jgi:two-component system sensor histidine kinase YesM
MRERNEKTTQSIRYLSDFYRISLNKGKQILSIQEELQLLKEYMKIQELRFEESIHITYEVKRELLPYRTIKLILQPLVENAIQHGRRSEEEVLHIQITIEEERDKVIFLVEDDGIGIEAERLHELQEKLRHSEEGYGLKNVDIRVKLNYGEEYGVKIASQLGKGTKVRVDIPKIE